jgi:hypothetical protein
VWRQHWDFQLYKALEHQFKRGLELFNKSMPEVRLAAGTAWSWACWMSTSPS